MSSSVAFVPAKLHDAGIGPLPDCSGCGERLVAGDVFVPPTDFSGSWSPFLDGPIYHPECRPADPPPDCSICGRQKLAICTWNQRLPVGYTCPGPHDDDLLPAR